MTKRELLAALNEWLAGIPGEQVRMKFENECKRLAREANSVYNFVLNKRREACQDNFGVAFLFAAKEFYLAEDRKYKNLAKKYFDDIARFYPNLAEAYLEGNCLTGKEFVHEVIRRLDKEVPPLEKKD